MSAPAAAPQVLALLDDAAAGAALLELSSALARLMQRELAVVYVESQHALHAAALPFAQVLSTHASSWQPLQPGDVEQGFRAQAARLRELSARVALRHAVACTLRVTRGSLAETAAALLAETDLLLLAGAPLPHASPAARRRPVVLLAAGGAQPRVRQVAAQLAQAVAGLLVELDGDPAATLHTPAGSAAAAQADLLVLPRAALAAPQLARLRCPVLLVG